MKDLVKQFLDNQISRRAFIKRMSAPGVASRDLHCRYENEEGLKANYLLVHLPSGEDPKQDCNYLGGNDE